MGKRIFHSIIILFATAYMTIPAGAQQSSAYEVNRLNINSNSFSEISPVITGDGLVYCSDRRVSGFRDRTSYSGDRLYSIFISEKKDETDWETPKEIKSERSNLFNNGPFCLTPDGEKVYFTSEVETGKLTRKRDYRNHNGIFIADFTGTDIVSLIPFKYNNPEYEVGQPSISSDGRYLFFASNMPGGEGGSDLYYCELIDGEWSEPVNLGSEVNSPAVENYPYIHPSGRLYFTSNRTGGLGGLDIYYSIMTSGSWEEPVLLPEPINSSSDDFSYISSDDMQKGYFSSNRYRNDDIYEFTSNILRKASCKELEENYYCYRFLEENAVKFDTLPFRYEWKFGDGESASGSVVEHCYNSPGTYLVQLDVVNLVTGDIMYNEKTDTLIITAIEQPYITAPDSVNVDQIIYLDADETNLPGWKIARYYWNFDDETIAIGRNVEKSYLRPGSYNIQLIVTDETGPGGMTREECVSKNIVVLPHP